MMSAKKRKLAIAYWVGVVIFLCCYLYASKIGEYRNSVRVTGMVKDRLWRIGKRDYKYPQFEFTFNDSVYISADHSIWVRGKRPGAKIKLIFPKGNPEEAEAYNFFSYWVSFQKTSISFMIAYFFYMMSILLGKNGHLKSSYRNK